MKYYTNYTGYTTMFELSNTYSRKILDLNPNTIVTALDEEVLQFSLLRVSCASSEGRIYSGWVEQTKISPYRETFAKDCVNLDTLKTPNSKDAEQYILWRKKVQHNMCGELCVAYIAGVPLRDVLVKWETNRSQSFMSVFNADYARGTSPLELIDMLESLGLNGRKYTSIQQTYKRYTDETLAALTCSIVGVKMNPITGRLSPKGVGHWVVLVDTWFERNGYGFIHVYNPFPNRIEVYSHQEFLAAAGNPLGIC